MYTFSTRALGLLMIGGLAGPVWAEAFEPTSQELSTDESYAVQAGDLDGDGHVDLVFGQYLSEIDIWTNKGQGSGEFDRVGQDPGNQHSTSLSLVDYDNDDDLDIFAGGASTTEKSTLDILSNDGGGSYPTVDSVSVSGASHGDWGVGDFNGDGRPDIAALRYDDTADQDTTTLTVWYGSDPPGYIDSDETHTLDNYSCAELGIADLTGDAADEIVLGCFPGQNTRKAGGIQVWEHDGGGLVSTTGVLETDWSLSDLAFPDLDGDGDRDILASHYSSDPPADAVSGHEHSTWINNGGSFEAVSFEQAVGTEFRGENLHVADLDGDGHDDVLVADGAYVRLYCGTDGADLAFASAAVDEGDAYVRDIASGDFDGDGQTDLALASAPGSLSGYNAADLILLQNEQDPCDGAASIGDAVSISDDDGGSDDEGGASGGGALGLIGLLVLMGLWTGRRTVNS